MSRKEKVRHTILSEENTKTKLVVKVSAINAGQKQLLKAIANPANSVVFVSGIAGSGKTYCSVSWGIEQFLRGTYQRLVFSRPVVEAGEHLGFLP